MDFGNPSYREALRSFLSEQKAPLSEVTNTTGSYQQPQYKTTYNLSSFMPENYKRRVNSNTIFIQYVSEQNCTGVTMQLGETCA